MLNPGRTIKRARELRGTMSLPEVLLWQAPMGPFILDFYCDEVRLAVEIDGYGHNMGDQPQRDRRRDEWLAGRGIRVLRLPAELVLKDMDSALDTITAWASGEAG